MSNQFTPSTKTTYQVCFRFNAEGDIQYYGEETDLATAKRWKEQLVSNKLYHKHEVRIRETKTVTRWLQ